MITMFGLANSLASITNAMIDFLEEREQEMRLRFRAQLKEFEDYEDS